ncbi:peptide/nickel transport system substrate-binding protein [Sulfitobacter brevis]|uniref:Peptide/nickel transport system substrate-binding protein n=1 Tax=Sulfitobacter brevis TaxID=74348 RepID=A0A1I2AJB1_9RHOB|nr:ABC transporter substrate-binding protein [Sulfitobacter brevis]SFE43986.1 peptide/nickel transport system substrate-binding protein [Sulfitobacter brevis]
MTHDINPRVTKMAQDVKAGRLDRREFLALASIFSVATPVAYGLIGATPAAAQEEPKKGGVLRIGQQILDINDPRTYDWPQKSNVARQFCEPLVRWEADGSFSPSLLESWEVSEDAKTYTLKVRQDAVWNNGDAFTAEDVIFNIKRMADSTAEGNSMAARLSALREGEATEAAEGAIEKVDDFTVRLNLFTPDISLIPSFGDYPALCVHPSFAGQLQDAPIGTGGFELVSFGVGEKAVLKRREDGKWWGGEVYLDGLEFIDLGSDDVAFVASFEADEIDMNDETTNNIEEVFNSIGLERAVALTATTAVARMNVNAAPFDNKELRNAVQLAVDNSICLELAIASLGTVADNHHVAPVHPEYAEVPRPPADPQRAKEVLDASGFSGEVELISIDEGELKDLADSVAAQMRDAGFNISRRTLPGATFWNDWTKYPFSTTSWGGRPLGVQVYALAYKTGEAWNESGHSNPEFDAKLSEALGIFDPEERKPLMAELEQMLQDSGVIIQPYWRELAMHHTAAVKGYVRHPLREMHLEKVWVDRDV